MKTISRRQFANALFLTGVSAALFACDNVGASAGLATVVGADETGSDIKETYFSDNDIAEIIKTLKSEYTPDGRLRRISQPYGILGLESGYHTDSDTLSISKPIPVYEYKDGAFVPQYPFYGDDAADAMFFLFDDDRLVYLIESAKSEYGETYRRDWGLEYVAFDYAQDLGGDNHSAAEAYAMSTTKKAALVFGEAGVYLYDGDKIWLVSIPLMGYAGIYDALNDDPITTPGLENLDLVDLTDRQTFAYDSPEIVIDYNGKTMTVDSVDDYEQAVESLL